MTFEDVLAAWLVKQRWFAGKGRTVHDLAVVADTEIIPGDPGLRQLLVTVSHGATSDCYQLFIGLRARLPARLRHARIGSFEGLQVYDGLHDSDLTRSLLDAIMADRTAGALRFCRIPGADLSWAAPGLDSLVPVSYTQLTLPGHGFYWFQLPPAREDRAQRQASAGPQLYHG